VFWSMRFESILHPNQTTRGFSEDTLQQLYPSTTSSLPFLSSRSTCKCPVRPDKQASITLECVAVSLSSLRVQYVQVACRGRHIVHHDTMSWALSLLVMEWPVLSQLDWYVSSLLDCVATAGLVCVVITRLARVVIWEFCSGAESRHGYNRIWA
jgi:hypothetical protein